jgi:Tetratricopeptide repeat
VTRIVLAVVAVLVIAWLGVMELDTRRQANGVSAAQRRDFAAADADFRAFLYERMGRHGQAAAVLEDVLRREPDNLTAWGLLFTFTRNHDRATAERALAARRRLDPVSARGG